MNPVPEDLPSLLAEPVRGRPESIAFIEGDRAISYQEFAALCARSAGWLAAHGIRKDDRVAVWLVNRLEWLALYFGLARLGAALITVNTRYRAGEVSYILEHSAATMLVLEPTFRKIDFAAVLAGIDAAPLKSLKRVVAIRRGHGAVPAQALNRPTETFDLDALADATVPAAATPEALSIVFTTSGTTSGPKLVAHTQRTIAVHSHYVGGERFGLREQTSKLLAALPLCGVFGLNGVLGAFAAGKPVVLMDTFDAAGAVDLIRKHDITHMFGSDEMFARMLDATPLAKPCPSARYFGFAAFHSGSDQLVETAHKRGFPMYGVYGSSEVQALFSGNDARVPRDEYYLGGGFPTHPHAEVRIRDTSTGKLLPPGRSGAIEIRCETNFVGYLDNPEATAKAIDADGFFKTGDLGHLRDDGSFVYETRLGDAIRLAGFLVSPAEIEDLLKQQPGIADAQIVGIDIGGHGRCVAFVLLSPEYAEIDESGIREALGRKLAPYKVPTHIWALEEFPTTASANGSKIQRTKLRVLAAEKLGETVDGLRRP